MLHSELDQLIARLLADPACSVSPAERTIMMPESLPADVRHFFTRCAGGGLYFSPDFPTPQFGCMLRYSAEQPVTQRLPCDCAEFELFYSLAEFDSSEYDTVVVSARPETQGHIFRLAYSLGDPPLTLADAHFLAPSFTRWLAMHVEAWSIYKNDWREGLNYFQRLIHDERSSRKHHAA
jgi:hypothetical protein